MFRKSLPLVSASAAMRYIVAAAIAAAPAAAVSESGGGHFRHLTMADGLSHPSVMSIFQDRLGRMWFGTREGLNIYDGAGIVSFKGWVDNPTTGIMEWFGNEVESLAEDSAGNIIALVDGDIMRYDLRGEYFTRITEDENVTALAGHKGFVAWTEGDSIFTLGHDLAPHYLTRGAGKAPVHHLAIDDTTLFISTSRGLVTVDRRNGRRDTLLTGRNIYSSLPGSDGLVWITVYDDGLYRLPPASRKASLVSAPAAHGSTAAYVQARNAAEDRRGRIWYGTFDGLFCYDPATSSTRRIQMPPTVGALTHSSLFGMFCDRDGNVWAGTYYGGVNFLSPEGDHSVNFAYDTETPRGLTMSLVTDMISDSRGHLWFGTDGAGVCCVDSAWNILTRLSTFGPSGQTLRANNIKTLAYDPEDGRLYIGTHLGGLSGYDIRSGTLRNLLDDGDSNPDAPGHIVQDITVSSGRVLISSDKGITALDPETGRFRHVSDLRSSRFDMDARGDIWAITDKGIWHIANPLGAAPDTRLFVPQGQLGRMVCVMCLPDGLCVGTHGNGIHYFPGYRDKHEQLHIRNSRLPSNYCYALSPLPGGGFVAATPAGVVATDFTGLNDICKAEFERISMSDFFPESHLIEGCSLLPRPDGDILVGSTRGVSLLPGRGKSKRPVPFFSRLYVGGRNVTASDGSHILDTSLPMASRINLGNHSDFTVSLGLSHIGASTGSPEIEYRLDGRDSDGRWHGAPAAWPISYSMLSPGNYRLRVRPAEPSSAAAERDEIGIDIIVPVPWYASWWAILLYAAAVGVVSFIIVRKSVDAARLRRSLREEARERDRIERLNREKLVFFTNVSHEFQTPLTLILSHADLLVSRYRRHARLAEGLGKIRGHAEQMSHLVTQLLEFRKLQQGHHTLHLAPRDAGKALRRATAPFADYARSRNMDFTVDAEEATAVFDESLIDRVLVNIISNAFKYTPDGGSVRCRAEQADGGGARFTVADTGRGISAGDLPFVFDRYYNGSASTATGAPPADYHTTGIGLAFAKTIVDSHHGTITVASEPGKGTTFTVTLPGDASAFDGDSMAVFDRADSPAYTECAGITAPAPQPCDKTADTPAHDGEGNDGELILIVEDNDELRANLTTFFAPFYSVAQAADGESGLAMARSLTPALIISDVMMPGISGIELCRAVKTHIETCHIPVILLTALGSTESKLEGLRADADDYVTKPFESALLLARVDNLLRAARRRRERWSSDASDSDGRAATDAPNPLDRRLLRKVKDTVDAHLADPELDVALLCREAGVGRSALFVKLKALTGLTPSAFIARERLSRAAEILRSQPHMSVEEVAAECGFSSAVYFRRCFKERFGAAPAQYRKEAATSAPDGETNPE